MSPADRLATARALFRAAQVRPTAYLLFRTRPGETRAEVLDRLHKARAAAWAAQS